MTADAHAATGFAPSIQPGADPGPRVLEFLRSPRPLLIDGEWVPAASGRTFETYNPATGGVLARVSEAVLKLEAKDAKWSDVTAAVRVAVQELRHEYGEDVTTVRVEAAGLVPEWATSVMQMEPEQLDWVITNLSLVGVVEGE